MEPESSGRSPFCNRLRSAPKFSRTASGKPLITLKELPSKTTSGGEGSATKNNVSEAGSFVYKYLYNCFPFLSATRDYRGGRRRCQASR